MYSIRTICNIPFIKHSSNEMRQKINCSEADYTDITSHFSTPTHLDAFIAILVLSGDTSIHINYKTFTLQKDSLVLLAASHLFYFDNCSLDFKCHFLFVGKEFMEEMDSTDMINKRVRYGVRLYSAPVIHLYPDNTSHLSDLIYKIDRAIDNTSHLYYKEVVLNNIFAFYLDLSDIIERSPEMNINNSLTRYESIIQLFIELLALHYRKEHKVDFYAAKLNLSTHHLTHIVKRITGQSVSDFISEMLYSESRTLLIDSKLSIQQIATLLNFADQSSFGKFFKRKAGVSPADFRKQ